MTVEYKVYVCTFCGAGMVMKKIGAPAPTQSMECQRCGNVCVPVASE